MKRKTIKKLIKKIKSDTLINVALIIGYTKNNGLLYQCLISIIFTLFSLQPTVKRQSVNTYVNRENKKEDAHKRSWAHSHTYDCQAQRECNHFTCSCCTCSCPFWKLLSCIHLLLKITSHFGKVTREFIYSQSQYCIK